MLRKAKIAIIHDAFLYRGGGERLVTEMAKALDADLIAGFFSDGSFDPRNLGFREKMIPLGKPVFIKGLRHIVLKWRFLTRAKMLRNYDIVIFSGDCLGAQRHISSHTKTLYYCHTPPRYLYDLRESYLTELPWWIRPIFRLAFLFFSRGYISKLRGFDQILSNSRNVHDRLLHYCGYESDIIYPPTDTSRFAPVKSGKLTVKSSGTNTLANLRIGEFENYFLSFARLSPPKRVDLIVDAFLEMPDRHLILTYGANDPMKDEILEKIQDRNNILAIESPSDDELIRLIQGATATLYIPVDEDFGMSPVESMACGTPVISVREGGILETVRERETGILIDIMSRERGILALREAVETMMRVSPDMRRACITRAREFSLEKFVERLHSVVSDLLKK